MITKFKFLLVGVLIAVSFSSCYTTKVTVGDVSPDQPMVMVNSVWNHHLLGGLIPLGNAKMRADKYVGDRMRYMIETNQSFLNLLVNFCTVGIYSPTTTSYYLPTDRYDYDNPGQNRPEGKNHNRMSEDDIYDSRSKRRAAKEAEIRNAKSIQKKALVIEEGESPTPDSDKELENK